MKEENHWTMSDEEIGVHIEALKAWFIHRKVDPFYAVVIMGGLMSSLIRNCSPQPELDTAVICATLKQRVGAQ